MDGTGRSSGAVIAGGWSAWPAALDPLVEEVKASLAEVAPDCPCRERVEQALDRMSRMHGLYRRMSALAEARERRDGILGLVELLADLDELALTEPDVTAFEEAAALFDDVAAMASAGAAAARRAGSALPGGAKERRSSE